jgi:tetratricopeptide (TPR) repeat protein
MVLYEKLKLEGKAALVIPAEIYHSKEILQSYSNIISSYTSGLFESDYEMAVFYLKKSISFGEKLQAQFPDDPYIKNEMALFYGRLSYYALYRKEFDVSIESAQKGVMYGKNYDWIYTNLALALLLKGNYEEAKMLYTSFKDKKITDNDFGSFRDSFQNDLDHFIDEKIIDTTNATLNRRINDIRHILN